MSNQTLIVLDQPPLDRPRWVGKLLEDAGYQEADHATIADRLKSDPDSAQALRDTFLQPDAQQILAPFYWRAFQSLYRDQPRVGIYGTAWLVFAPRVDACIVDWSGLGMITSDIAEKLTLDEAREARNADIALGRNFIRGRASVLPVDRFLELPEDIDDAQRVELGVSFLRERGLA